MDGLADTNPMYRINSKWEDIQAAMKYCAHRARVHWKYIVFQHNEHQLEEAKTLAKSLGVEVIIFKKSARFREKDKLAPKNETFVGVVSRNRRKITDTFQKSGLQIREIDESVKVMSRCRSGKNLAITARGYLYPCTVCETSNTSTWFYKNRESFNLRTHSLDEVLSSEKWEELEKLWGNFSTAPDACRQNCGVHQEFVDVYAQESRGDRVNKPEDVEEHFFR